MLVIDAGTGAEFETCLEKLGIIPGGGRPIWNEAVFKYLRKNKVKGKAGVCVRDSSSH